jgi:hypothetical protein
MKKAVRLRLLLEVRGDDEPAHDFAAAASRAIREIIQAGRSAHPELSVRVRRVVEDDGGGQDDEDEGAAS